MRSVIIDGPESWSQVRAPTGVVIGAVLPTRGFSHGAGDSLEKKLTEDGHNTLTGCQADTCRAVPLAVPLAGYREPGSVLRALAVLSQVLVEEGIVERFIGLDMSDAETVFDRCLEAIKKVKKVRWKSGGNQSTHRFVLVRATVR